ncbi:SLOG family protein [Enterocloster clostridioformis]|uniref:DUF2493 domain-containing protein n=1 Tax=Enterocloster clostridioformis TaxID=1531 RepID=A0A829WJB4_9FIRM|nr:SLOG family protein [Enterocloster clostridioformis]EHG33254.1 hypothetical protein HMPREF9467_00865 [ [[Clostridium] clostridioforme 2_1_49FAA]ENZ28632.1 hypothetical protein HMPREF1087_01125 [[Clostridium] clostridioforme 90A1]ENZ73437.1 hypothetical protein HMPREF1081_00046 [[Clostridium] clostridioforme 90A4]QIX89178.1 DUF2493 domain-containing protein [Enterocloster clostridioformis]GEA37480.1 hypothetical protein Ccl03g_31930 [Enterocloster clostridioformis]
MKELRIIVAGGRDFNDFPLLMNKCIGIIATVTKEDNTIDKIRIVSGSARGADKLGEQYAQIAHYDVSRFPAAWDIYGKSAGYRRNADMAKFASEEGNIGILIAFWDGKSRGTKHMIDLAKRYGLDVYVVNY